MACSLDVVKLIQKIFISAYKLAFNWSVTKISDFLLSLSSLWIESYANIDADADGRKILSAPG